jgi:cytochrome b involved in lipid metabolism
MKKLSEITKQYFNIKDMINKGHDNLIAMEEAHWAGHLTQDIKAWVIEHIKELNEKNRNGLFDEVITQDIIDYLMEMFELKEEDL